MHAMCLIFVATSLAQTPDLSFHPDPAAKDRFTYDTGQFKGALVVNEQWEGIVSCIDTATGTELLKGNGKLGLFHLYRLLAENNRYGDTIWGMPKKCALVEHEGDVEVKWPSSATMPFEITATYKWSAPNTLDTQIDLRLVGEEIVRKTEVFVGSYASGDTTPLMYLKANRYAVDKASALVPIESNALLTGTYCMFPRDPAAAQLIFDGRWLIGANVVDWAVTRSMAAPLAIQRNEKAGRDIIFMADPRNCFAVGMSYHQETRDGVSDHHSTYFSLFGEDFKRGERRSALVRAVIGPPLSVELAVQKFDNFKRVVLSQPVSSGVSTP